MDHRVTARTTDGQLRPRSSRSALPKAMLMVRGSSPANESRPSAHARRVRVAHRATTTTAAVEERRVSLATSQATSTTITTTRNASKPLYVSRVRKTVKTDRLQATEPGKNRPWRVIHKST